MGAIGTRHHRVLRGIGAEVVAIPARGSRVHELPRPAATSIANALPLDALVIATETERHPQDVCSAIDAGVRTILVEKPCAPTAAEARRVDIGRSRVFVGCCLRFDESLQLARSLLPRVGKVHAIDIECRSYLPDWHPGRDHRESYSASPTQGGVLRDLIHEIDYALWLFGGPRAVSAALGDGRSIGIASEASASLRWRTADGAIVQIGLDYLTRVPTRGMRIHGAEGTLAWDMLRRTVELHTPEGVRSQTAPGQRDDMYVAQSTALVEMVHGKANDFAATWQDGVHALAVIDAARRSADTGEEVEVSAWTA